MRNIGVWGHTALIAALLAALVRETDGDMNPIADPSVRDLVSQGKKEGISLFLLDSVNLSDNELNRVLGIRGYDEDIRVIVISGNQSQNEAEEGATPPRDLEYYQKLDEIDAVIDRNDPEAPEKLKAALRLFSKPVPTTGQGNGRGQTDLGRLRLTGKQAMVAQLVSEGSTNRIIAEKVALREQSVKNMVSAIMEKMRNCGLECNNRVMVGLRFRELKEANKREGA